MHDVENGGRELACKTCGNTNVTARGEFAWNAKWGLWDPTGTIDSYHCHGECNSETKVERVKAAAA